MCWSKRYVYSVCCHARDVRKRECEVSRLLREADGNVLCLSWWKRQCSDEMSVSVRYGFCRACRAHFAPRPTQDVRLVLRYWAYKNEHGLVAPVPASDVPADALFGEAARPPAENLRRTRCEVVCLADAYRHWRHKFAGAADMVAKMEDIRSATLDWAEQGRPLLLPSLPSSQRLHVTMSRQPILTDEDIADLLRGASRPHEPMSCCYTATATATAVSVDSPREPPYINVDAYATLCSTTADAAHAIATGERVTGERVTGEDKSTDAKRDAVHKKRVRIQSPRQSALYRRRKNGAEVDDVITPPSSRFSLGSASTESSPDPASIESSPERHASSSPTAAGTSPHLAHAIFQQAKAVTMCRGKEVAMLDQATAISLCRGRAAEIEVPRRRLSALVSQRAGSGTAAAAEVYDAADELAQPVPQRTRPHVPAVVTRSERHVEMRFLVEYGERDVALVAVDENGDPLLREIKSANAMLAKSAWPDSLSQPPRSRTPSDSSSCSSVCRCDADGDELCVPCVYHLMQSTSDQRSWSVST